MSMAGLFDVWSAGADDAPLYTYTILTTDSSKRLEWCVLPDTWFAPWHTLPLIWASAALTQQLGSSCTGLTEPYKSWALASRLWRMTQNVLMLCDIQTLNPLLSVSSTSVQNLQLDVFKHMPWLWCTAATARCQWDEWCNAGCMIECQLF